MSSMMFQAKMDAQANVQHAYLHEMKQNAVFPQTLLMQIAKVTDTIQLGRFPTVQWSGIKSMCGNAVLVVVAAQPL